MKVKEEGEKVDLKLNIQKINNMASEYIYIYIFFLTTLMICLKLQYLFLYVEKNYLQ